MIMTMNNFKELLTEINERSSEKSRLIGNSIAHLEFLIEWLENPKERILPLEIILRMSRELLTKLNK